MKAEQLMMGDWINLKRKNGEDCYYKVTSIRQRDKDNSENDYIDVKCGTVYGFCAEPIPITPEILEKNGFKRYGFSNIFGINILGNNSSIDLISHNCAIRGEDITINSRKMLYVHELQHAIRLCKIDKEIEL